MSVFDKDWFDRNSKFVVQDKSESIGWDANYVDGYSKFLYSSSIASNIANDKTMLLNELYELIYAVGLNDVRCIVNSIDESYTDGKTIVVSNSMHEDNCFKKLDIIFGCTIHECCHCIYSDFNAVIKPSSYEDSIAKHIQNIIEDEVIEEKLSGKHQGYANFLSATKHYYFHDAIEKITSEERTNLLDEILSILLLIVRWPEHVKEYVAKSDNAAELEDVFYKIKECMSTNGILDTKAHYSVTHKTNKTARDILDIIREYLDNSRSENGNSGFSKEAKECCESGSSEMSEYNNAAESVSSSGDTECSNQEYNEKISKAIDDFEKSIEATIAAKRIVDASFLKKTGFNKASAKDIERYEAIRRENTALTRLFKQCIIENGHVEKIFVENNMRSGAIPSGKIAEAYQGVSNIYDRRTIKVENKAKPKYALLILVDESGSMCNLNKMCSQLVISIYEAMQSFKSIDLFIYGHGDTITAYIDHSNKNKFTLSKIRKQMEQDEAVSYEEILSKVHSMTNLPIVTISITDSYYVTDFSKLKEVIGKYKAKGDSFNLIRLLENDYDYDGENGVDANNDLYGAGNWVSIDARDKNAAYEAAKKLSILMKRSFTKK